jgi:membrane-bound serine protease (ClpP class)
MSLKQRILGFLMNPNITFIVLAIGALALYFEFNNPGAILPGVVGALFILLAAFALNLLPTRFAALALILLAFILFGLEAKFTSHGILGTGGIVSLTLGALLLVDGPIPEMRVRLWTALAVSVPLGVITIFLMTIALRAHRNKVITGEQGLVGEIGVARSDLNLQGKVFVHGELWDAHSSSPIASGDSVVVERVNGMLLDVRPAHVREPASAG